jgi:hypothetical protein
MDADPEAFPTLGHVQIALLPHNSFHWQVNLTGKPLPLLQRSAARLLVPRSSPAVFEPHLRGN